MRQVCQSGSCFLSLQVSLIDVRDYKSGVEEAVSSAKIWRGKKRVRAGFMKLQPNENCP